MRRETRSRDGNRTGAQRTFARYRRLLGTWISGGARRLAVSPVRSTGLAHVRSYGALRKPNDAGIGTEVDKNDLALRINGRQWGRIVPGRGPTERATSVAPDGRDIPS